MAMTEQEKMETILEFFVTLHAHGYISASMLMDLIGELPSSFKVKRKEVDEQLKDSTALIDKESSSVSIIISDGVETTDQLTIRIRQYAALQRHGYLSMMMLMHLVEGLKASFKTTEKVIMDKLNEALATIKKDNSSVSIEPYMC